MLHDSGDDGKHNGYIGLAMVKISEIIWHRTLFFHRTAEHDLWCLPPFTRVNTSHDHKLNRFMVFLSLAKKILWTLPDWSAWNLHTIPVIALTTLTFYHSHSGWNFTDDRSSFIIHRSVSVHPYLPMKIEISHTSASKIFRLTEQEASK